MFGLSMGEIMLLVIVGIVVVGPKNLPALMRTAGHWIGRLRRMSSDLRSQSGIDELIRQEGLEREINELRSLSRGNVIDTFITPAMATAVGPRPAARVAARDDDRAAPPPALAPSEPPLREREYPLLGCDAYGALQEDAVPYPVPPPDEPADDDPRPATEPSASAESSA